MFGKARLKSIIGGEIHCPTSQLRVLVVDERVSLHSVMRPTLHKLGIDDFDEAVTVSQGLAKLKDPDGPEYDLVICGSAGPELDPLAFCNRVRRTATLRNKQIPILVLTGEEDRLLLDVVLDAGASAVMSRPVSAAELLRRIERAVGICFDQAARVVARPRRRLAAHAFIRPFGW
jgi:two-component system, chemotaxis family, chemotaxis protein CheY